MHLPWERAGLTPAELQYDCYTYLARTTTDRVLEAIPVRLREPVRVDGILYVTLYNIVPTDADSGMGSLYGTQIHQVDGVYQPINQADPENVDQRRALVGLQPLADYLRNFLDDD